MTPTNTGHPVHNRSSPRSRAVLVEVEPTWTKAPALPDMYDATPPLPGPWPVGVRQFCATDASRLDSSTGVRRLMVAAWYPGKPDPGAPRSGPKDLLLQYADAAITALAEKAAVTIGLDSMRDRLNALAFRAQRGLEADGGAHPVLLFYPPGMGHRFSKAGLCESLASIGYVVLALDAPRDAPILVYPDGKIVTGPMGSDEDYIWPRVADIRFLLDQLPDLDRAGSLARQLDLEKIGMFGGSRGGYVSNIMAVADDRITAAVNMDGFLWGLWVDDGTGLSHYPKEWQELARISRTPVMRLQGEQTSAAAHANFENERMDFGGEFLYASLRGFKHDGFAPTPWLCGAVEKCLDVSAEPNFDRYDLLLGLLSGFFGRHLRNEAGDWLQRLSERHALDILAWSKCLSNEK